MKINSDTVWLLANVLGVDRPILQSHADYPLTPEQEKLFNDYLQRYQQGEPLAYILGEQPFHNITLQVNPDVLIPRSETELLVEFVLQHFAKQENITLADLGTGSGAIALALAKAQPRWKIIATDISETALSVARANAQRLHMNHVEFITSDWFTNLSQQKFHAIISNPPYIAEADRAIAESVKKHEPHLALFAEQNGFAALQHIITHSKNYLLPNGLLIVEHGYQQGAAIRALFAENGYQGVITHHDYAGHERFTTATHS